MQNIQLVFSNRILLEALQKYSNDSFAQIEQERLRSSNIIQVDRLAQHDQQVNEVYHREKTKLSRENISFVVANTNENQKSSIDRTCYTLYVEKNIREMKQEQDDNDTAA